MSDNCSCEHASTCYTCDICESTTAQSSLPSVHVRTNHAEPNFDACSTCCKTFETCHNHKNHNLLNHRIGQIDGNLSLSLSLNGSLDNDDVSLSPPMSPSILEPSYDDIFGQESFTTTEMSVSSLLSISVATDPASNSCSCYFSPTCDCPCPCSSCSPS